MEPFFDLALAGVLLLSAFAFRAKFKIFQLTLLPASIIGGFAGLALGPNGFELLPFSDSLSAYPGILIALIYAALPFSSPQENSRELSKRSPRLWAYSVFAIMTQWAVGFLVTVLILQFFWPDLHAGFATILASGFVGGHGTAAAIGVSFSETGWREAGSLAMTSATVGILGSIAGGMAWIRWGTRAGYSRFTVRFENLPQDLRTGVLSKAARRPSGEETIAASSLDPLIFQVCIVFTGFLCGIYLSNAWAFFFPDFKLPLFCLSFISALCIKNALLQWGVVSLIDRRTMLRIAGSLTDLLIVFGICSIQFPIIIEYAAPLAIMFAAGFLLCALIFRLCGPLFIGSYWYETALFTWGWITGIMAMGIALLRIVDAENKSQVLDSFAFAYLFVVPFEVVMVSLAPQLIAHNMQWVIITTTSLLALSLLSIVMVVNRNRR